MKNLHYYLILVGLGFHLKTNAQIGVSGKLKAEYVPFSNYVRPIDSLKTGSTSDFKRVQGAVGIPLYTKMDTLGRAKAWALLMEGSYATITNRDYDEKLFPTRMLNAQVGLIHSRPLGKTWSIIAMASIGVYTDMEEITSKDFLAQGGVLFVKHFKPTLAFGFGPVVTNTFGIPMVLPGIYFDWVTKGRYQLHINLPEGLDFGVQLSKTFQLKTVIELSGMTAEVNKENKSMLLGYQQIVAGLRPEVKLGKYLTFSVTGGSTLVRSFDLQSRKLKDMFKTIDQASPRFTTTAYGAVGLSWNFSKALSAK
ncbi:DUF6268 family outer membrane beta-barrel protein [Pedobacter nyackensis]|uniref:DUF6268 family outer membrane beta-barrel protein n=1 Tax=Pedobacter nyackensis TaxID=475255 RepID=UPI00292F5696|nr:DUF6268 family outer membrane beta-barrel protein [Pedobacter nyackensis]